MPPKMRMPLGLDRLPYIALLNHTITALRASSDSLPDDFAVIAEAELIGAIADYGAVFGAGGGVVGVV